MKKFIKVILYIVLTVVLAFVSYKLSRLWICRTGMSAAVVLVLCVILTKKGVIKMKACLPLVIALFLVPNNDLIKDGGTRSYSTLFYEVRVYHRMIGDPKYDGFVKGTEIKILGLTVYADTYIDHTP